MGSLPAAAVGTCSGAALLPAAAALLVLTAQQGWSEAPCNVMVTEFLPQWCHGECAVLSQARCGC